jgi:hypothetical protein
VEHAAEADHGEAAVPDLGPLIVLPRVGVLAEAEGVKAKVAGGRVGVVDLLVREGLDGADGDEDLGPAGGADVVEGLEGVGGEGSKLGKLGELREDHAKGGKHADAAVLDLGLAEPLEVIVVGEAKGVKARVAGEGAVELGGALKEGDGLGHRAGLHGGAAGDGSASSSLGQGDRARGEGRGRRNHARQNNRAQHSYFCDEILKHFRLREISGPAS